MSYCRFGGRSQVYVYRSSAGLECCGCRLKPRTHVVFNQPEQMIAHLAAHRRAGQHVPFKVIKRLWQDIQSHQEGKP